MDPDEDMEDIKRLNDIINAENSAKEDNLNFGLLESDSSESEESDNDYSSIATHKTVEEMDYAELIETTNLQNSEFDNLHDLSNLTPHLTYEEFDLISNCEDPALKRLLILNRVKKVQLKYLNNKYYNLLLECENNLKFEHDKLARSNEINRHSRFNNFAKVGRPYFRDSKQFPAPPNADVIKKKKNCEVNALYFPKKKVWNICNQISLKSNVMMHYFKAVLKSLEGELWEAKVAKDAGRQDLIEQKIECWKNNFNGMEPPDFWDDTHINWEDIALKQFNDTLCFNACRGFWNLYVHPSINKSPIVGEEKERFLKLVAKYQEQNWDAIANDLNNNRSPYLLCVEYFTKMIPKKNTRDLFTKEEDEQLLKMIAANKVGNHVPWRKIAYHLDDASTRLYHRYRYSLSKGNHKLGKFSESEDILLLCLAKKHDEDFNKIAIEMPHRKKSLLMTRYYEYLKRAPQNLGNWTVEEDRKILEHVSEHGTRKWINLTSEIERASCHIRHRYFFLKKRMATNPNFCLEGLARKSFKPLALSSRAKRAQYSVEHFMQTNTLPILDVSETTAAEDRVPRRGRPQRQHIDHQLTNYFRSTAHIRKERHRKTISLASIDKCAQSIKSILDTLGVELKIPGDFEIDDHPELNEIDREVLLKLKTINTSSSLDCPEEITPNVNSIQALRCLLLKYREFKDLSANKEKIKPSSDLEIQLHRQNFVERFRAIFRWPCLMSIVEPPEEVVVERDEEELVETFKKIGRPLKNLTKIQKMNQTRIKKLQDKKKAATAATTSTNSSDQSSAPPIVLNAGLATVKKEPTAMKSYQAADSWRIKQEPSEDAEVADDPDVISTECTDLTASTSNIDLPMNLDPSDTQVKLHLPAITPNMQNISYSMDMKFADGLTKMINKNTFSNQKIIRKVSMEELAELKKKGNKFVVLKTLKRPAAGNALGAVDAKKVKREPSNVVCKMEK